MDADEVPIHEMNRYGVSVIVDLLRETIGEASKATHVHPHGEILPLYVAGADMLGVGVAAHGFHVATDADRRRVSRFVL